MLIKVKVFPGSKKQEVVKKTIDSFDVFVKEIPKEGRATKEVIGLLSFYFKVPAFKVRLIKGARERNKIFEIAD